MKRITLLAATALLYVSMMPLQPLLAQGAPAAAEAVTPDQALEAAALAAAAADHGGRAHSGGLFQVIMKSGWFGVMIWLLLVAGLVGCVTLVVDSYLTVREKNIAPVEVINSVRAAMQEGDLLKAINHCEHNPGPLANILKAGFSNVEDGFEVIQDSVSVAADIESERLLSKVTYLSVISNATPMLGLIGTVQGMIFAFATLGTTEAGAAQQAMLALNISHGLWATAVGLTTAVPATIYYFYFKNKANRIILGMEALTLDVIKSLRNVEVVSE
ncbi:MAG: MotA/TolQ/ExbB proton channel family protein [Verrucomicrobia bacterium]|nr:MotA/TolQ/ExbB proton channel family protein [Verrucomicrobiota bacterium]